MLSLRSLQLYVPFYFERLLRVYDLLDTWTTLIYRRMIITVKNCFSFISFRLCEKIRGFFHGDDFEIEQPRRECTKADAVEKELRIDQGPLCGSSSSLLCVRWLNPAVKLAYNQSRPR